MSAVPQAMSGDQESRPATHAVEEIRLEGGVDQAPLETVPAEQRVVEQRLEQISKLKGFRFEFGVTNDNYLRVKTSQPMKPRRSFDVNLSVVDPSPKRVIRVNWAWWYALFAAGEAAIIVALLYSDTLLKFSGFQSLFAVLVATTILCGLAFAFCIQDRLLFQSRNGRVVLFEMANRAPNKAVVQAFVARLRDRAKIALRASGGDAERRLAAELREHRRLHESGVLSNAQYDRAKTRLLAMHASGKVVRRTLESSQNTELRPIRG